MATKNGEGSISEEHRGKLTTVSYEWVSTVTRKRSAQSSCFQTLIKYFKLYCKHSSLVGLKYLVEERVTWIERFLWIAVYAYIVRLVSSYTWAVYEEYVNTPITTTLDGEYFLTQNLEFPAVAICSVNRMSRRAAKKLATDMFNANISTLSAEEILKRILVVGDVYSSSFMRDDDYSEAIDLLTNFYGKDYDITNMMKNLTPQCSDMLQLCSFRAEVRNCSELFQMHKTQEGFCCIFNYGTESEEIINQAGKPEKSPLVHKVGEIGLMYGLHVVMEPFLDDYFYPIIPATGWKVMILNPFDYLDTASGGVIEALVAASTEKYLEVRAVGLESTEDIRKYPIQKRRCIFADEKTSISSKYSDSDCILECKMEDLWKACRCRPFFYPFQGIAKHINRTCGVEDIYCLWDYKGKIDHIVTFMEDSLKDLIDDANRTLYCNNCYPPCNAITYITRSMIFAMQSGQYKSQVLPAINITNQSVLHIFFSEGRTTYLKQDESYRWYEYMSDACGIIAFFVGFSLISLVELFYFNVLLLLDLLEPDPDPRTIREDEIPHKQSPVRAIYWNELFPRSKDDMEKLGRSGLLF